jgi:hypothetical protein
MTHRTTPRVAQATNRPRPNYLHCQPSASVTDGRELQGYPLDQPDHQVAALTLERVLIGTYADRAAARHAIAEYHAGVP